MQGKFGKNTWKVIATGIAGKATVVVCVALLLFIGYDQLLPTLKNFTATVPEVKMQRISSDFFLGLVQLVIAVGMIVFIIRNHEWPKKQLLMKTGIAGAIISEVADAMLGFNCVGMVGVFVIAAVLAKVGLTVIPLYLELFIVLGYGLVNIIKVLPQNIQDVCGAFVGSTLGLVLLIALPPILIALKVYMIDKKK